MATSRAGSRAAWGSISRDAVVGKAVEVVRAGRGGDVSIRALAAQLEVSPMALYRHVENKEDLLDEVVSRLFAEQWRPAAQPGDWRAWTAEAADRLRGFLVEYPVALQVYLARPVATPTALERMEACLGVLRDGLGDEARARSAYAAVQSYTIGFAALQAARASSPPDTDALRTAAERELAGYASPAQFRAGLDYLLEGIEIGHGAFDDGSQSRR